MTEILWTADEVQKATDGKLIKGDDWSATGFAMDSRSVTSGDIFIAMVGQIGGLDGHDFVQSAADNGAVAAIVMRELDVNIPQIIVKDSYQAMVDMGQFARNRATLQKSIAITGSVGKTGVRKMLNTAFEATNMRPHASIKSYNNYVGVPFTLANMKASTDVGVFEIGMNHANEITPLSKMVRPDIAIITWIADVHIENFDNGIEGIIKAKSEIFDGMNSDGTAILPRDNDHYAALVANAKTVGLSKIYSFGEHEDADAKLIDAMVASNGTRVMADIDGERVSYTLLIPGKHQAINSLSVLLAVKLSGGDVQAAAYALEQIEPVEGRGNQEEIRSGDPDNPITLINESYNASPVAMNAAFKVLAMVDPGRGGRRIAVLGDMLELGDRSKAMHEDLAMPIQAAGVDLLYCSGKHMKALYDKMPPANQGAHRETAEELAEIVPDALVPGDVVMVKGSLGSRMKAVVEAMRAMGK
jgi:UDP-N-acetylmuramoyl-tripeptide--D-alanyl-D-alanine ligase